MIHLVQIFLNAFSLKYEIIIFLQFYYSFYSQQSYKKTNMFRYNTPRKCSFQKVKNINYFLQLIYKKPFGKVYSFYSFIGVDFCLAILKSFSVFYRNCVKTYLIKYQCFNSDNCLSIPNYMLSFLILTRAAPSQQSLNVSLLSVG